MKKNVYAVLAGNAVGIATEWSKAEKLLEDCTGARYTKGFPTFEEAQDAAVEHLEEITFLKKIPTRFPVNRLVYVKNLKRITI